MGDRTKRDTEPELRGYSRQPSSERWVLVPEDRVAEFAYRGAERSRQEHATTDWSKWLGLLVTVVGGIVAAVWVLASMLGNHATADDVHESAAVIKADVRANDKRIDGHEVRLQVIEQQWRTITGTLKEIRDDVKSLKEKER